MAVLAPLALAGDEGNVKDPSLAGELAAQMKALALTPKSLAENLALDDARVREVLSGIRNTLPNLLPIAAELRFDVGYVALAFVRDELRAFLRKAEKSAAKARKQAPDNAASKARKEGASEALVEAVSDALDELEALLSWWHRFRPSSLRRLAFRKHRLENRMSTGEVAKLINVLPEQVRDFEAGKLPLSDAQIEGWFKGAGFAQQENPRREGMGLRLLHVATDTIEWRHLRTVRGKVRAKQDGVEIRVPDGCSLESGRTRSVFGGATIELLRARQSADRKPGANIEIAAIHAGLEMAWLYSGRALLHIGRKKLELRPPEIVTFDSGQAHRTVIPDSGETLIGTLNLTRNVLLSRRLEHRPWPGRNPSRLPIR